MKIVLKLEELALFLAGIFMFSLLDFKWWWFPALLLLPDIGMLGYLISSKMGAITYNIFHHRAVAIIVGFVGWMLSQDILLLCGIILFSHIAMDRVFGYGLKYPDHFKHTHLGAIGT